MARTSKPVAPSEWPESNLDVSDDVEVLDAAPKEKLVCIILEDNDEIPPTGQFFGADGRGSMLRSGEEAWVPQSILNILDCAITGQPVTDGSNTVTHYRPRLRFPYRIVTGRQRA